jgi:predicted NBD/HSP70 family sugar kinase
VRLLRLLRLSGAMTQAEMARRSGLAAATVSNIVRELQAAGVVEATERGTHSGRGSVLRLVPLSHLVAAVDIGHRHLTVAVADAEHTILTERRVDLNVGHTTVACLTQAAKMLDESIAELGIARGKVLAAGIGLPAPIDNRTRQVGAPSILPGWVGVDAAQVASEYLDLPAYVDNDANLGVLAEHAWGAGQGSSDLAYLKLSDGVGAGLVVNNEIFRGRGGTAGEVGHITMNEFGAVCRCGNRGCLETLVAAREIIGLLEPVRGPGLTVAAIVEMATHGDIACGRVLADAGRQIGIAVASLCNVFNPERILVGGELAQAGDLVLAPLQDMVRRYAIPTAASTVKILPSALGARSHLLGAVWLALHEAAAVDP